MVKTYGAVDRVLKRKTRTDTGKSRKTYAGRNVKEHRRTIRFERRRGNKTHLKLWWWRQLPMSKEGYYKWNKKARPMIKKIIYKFGIRVDTPVEQLASKKLLEEWALDNIGFDGYFLVMGCSGSPRTKTGVKWVKLFSVRILDSEAGLRAKVINNYRMWRYGWFWTG